MSYFSIAIDGPAAAGKSTIAKKVAKELNFTYIDTGAMYRAVTLYVLNKGLDPKDEELSCSLIDEINIVLDSSNRVFLNGNDVTKDIRLRNVADNVSYIASYKKIRLFLVEQQRKMAETSSVVMDGRDIGSYVLPNAEYKFYITADIDERARRRFLELELKGTKNITFDSVRTEMIARDEQDTKRDFAPLVVPTGAYVIDTTNLKVEEVLDIILSKINK